VSGGAYSALPETIAGFKRPTSKGREGNGRGGGMRRKRRVRKGRERRGREGGGFAKA